jgi:hypothetical protein
MSVIVKDVVMPDECMYCEFGMYGFYGTRCQLRDNGRRIIPMECIDNGTRPDWCPLVEIPKGARLIDAEALYMDIIHRFDYCDDFLEMLDEAPVIFEEGDE